MVLAIDMSGSMAWSAAGGGSRIAAARNAATVLVDVLFGNNATKDLLKSDPEAKIAKMKDGTTHLAYKPEHAVDLDTGAVVAAELHPADEGDTTTLEKTLAAAKENLEAVDAAPTAEDPAECVTDKGYHSRSVLKASTTAPGRRGSPYAIQIRGIRTTFPPPRELYPLCSHPMA